MRRIIFSLCILAIFTFCFAQTLWADELSELKAQLKTMQKQMQEQAKQIEAMQEKVEQLENERAARIETPEEMEERVVALEEKIAKEEGIDVYWQDGLTCTIDEPACQIKIGGRIHMDSVWFEQESKLKASVGDADDDAEFRRARLYTKGTLYENAIFKLEYDFVTDPPSLRDGYIGVKDIPILGTVRAGHMFEPFGLENMTSTNYLTFVEFGLPEAFAPIRNIGIEAHSTLFDQRMTWATGIFRDADNSGRLSSHSSNWTSRLTFLPWYEDDGERLLHLGASYSLRGSDDTLQYCSCPETHLGPYFVNTGSFAAEGINLLGTEAAIVYGPLSLQGEYMGSIVDQRGTNPDVYFQGCYGYLSYFLTGEHRSYSKSGGVFSRLRPINNFSLKEKTFGAWELAARYSWLDLNDDNIDGEAMSDITAGLNWYLNPNMRLMGNYIHSHREGAGDADIFLTRFQVDF